MKTIWITIVIYGFLWGSLPAYAKIYKWVDENGKVHFTDDPSLVPQTEDAKVKTFREILSVKKPVLKNDSPSEPASDEKTHTEISPPQKPKSSKKKEVTSESLAEEKKSYQELLAKSRESRERQLKKISELQEMDEKPKTWTTNESLDEIIEGLQKSVKRSEKEIRKYEREIKSFSLTD
ncbi:MAG: DUF4124 domain-containing protein [Nitrospinae bacterium]|nr:DUF4124 domain-containing protein [Nitrospinota bacterium]